MQRPNEVVEGKLLFCFSALWKKLSAVTLRILSRSSLGQCVARQSAVGNWEAVTEAVGSALSPSFNSGWKLVNKIGDWDRFEHTG